MGCDDEHESSLGPFAENGEEEWGEVERRTRMRMKRGENEDDPEDNGVGGGQGG